MYVWKISGTDRPLINDYFSLLKIYTQYSDDKKALLKISPYKIQTHIYHTFLLHLINHAKWLFHLFNFYFFCQQLGGLLSGRMKHPKLYLIRLSLWALSTWIGTLILCGRKSLTPHFPYLKTFSQLSPQTRQDILLSWSRSFFPLLRMLYLGLKILSLLVFFTQVIIYFVLLFCLFIG